MSDKDLFEKLWENQAQQLESKKAKLTGLNVNYYLVKVPHPQREEQNAYQAECDDIADALELTPDEKDIFKEIWRTANARLHNGKPGHNPLYAVEKIFHRAQRMLRRATLKEAENADKQQRSGNTLP